jgi:hypothetical protein
MREAPRDGRIVFVHSASQKKTLLCYWDRDPAGLAGPAWIEQHRDQSGTHTGYLDRYFSGWLDPATFIPVGIDDVPRLLVAYIDDAREADDRDALRLLENPGFQDDDQRTG